MNIRKGMAALLAIAMILTSQSFASVVGATELTSQATQTQEVVEQQTEEDATGVLTTVADENEKGEAIEKSETLDTEDNKEVVSEEIKSSEKAISDDEQATQTEEAIISDVENTATDNAEKLEASDEESSDAISDTEKNVGEDDADVDDEGSVDEESDDAIEAAADYFKLEIIDGKSVLRKKTKDEGGKDMGDTVTIFAGAEVIPDDIFQNNHTVRNIVFEEGSKLTTIAPNAFRNSYVESIKIPKGVTEIPSGAFMGSHLGDLRFEDEGSIKAIGVNAFNSTRIESITLPGCREVGESAFANCTSLSTVTMKVLETIGDQAFFKCSLLNDFLWSSEIRAIGSRAFSGCAFETIALNGMTKLRSISSSSGDLLSIASNISYCGNVSEGIYNCLLNDFAFSKS